MKCLINKSLGVSSLESLLDFYLDIKSESALVVRPHPDGNQTMSISVTIAVRLKIAIKIFI